MKKSIWILAALLMSVMAVTGCKSQDQIDAQQQVVAAAENAYYYDTRSTISVTGKGEVVMEPDIAAVGFTVYTSAANPSDAQQENTGLMTAVLEVIRAKGVAEEDIETGNLNIHEVYDYDKSPARIVGYDVYHSVEVKVRDMDVLGSLISDAIGAGASSVSGPEYSVEDDSAAYLEALSLAVQSANAKAETIAAGTGGRLANLPVSLSEYGGVNYAVRTYAADNAVAKAAPMEEAAESGLEAAETVVPKIEITATVTGVYQIIP